MSINPAIFKAYDIRGIYPQDINEENFEPVVQGIYSFFVRDLKKKNLSVALGRDMRISSPALFEVAKKTLVRLGAHVTDMGLVSTPTFYFGSLQYGFDIGIQVTASHNPKEYAGVKFVKRMGDKILKIGKSTGMDQVKENVLTNNFEAYTDDGTVVENNHVLADEIEAALKTINRDEIKKFVVASDPANGMGSLYVESLFEKVPGELIKMNFELDGTFPVHLADPLDFNNLKPLQEKVLEVKADFGIAPDGDGDRVFFINERGEVIPATFITSLITKEILANHPGEKIVADIRYTRNVKNMVEGNGGKFLVSKVGHAFITEQVNKEGAYFAGESSGHFYFGATGGAESSVRVILYVLMALSETGKPLSQILKQLQSSYESGELNFVLPDSVNNKELMGQIAKEYKGEVSWLDGVSVDFPEWRFNIRSSNTEPLLRLNVESTSQELTKQKFEELTQKILSSGAKRKESSH